MAERSQHVSAPSPARRRPLAPLSALPRSPLLSYARRALDVLRPPRALRERARLAFRELMSSNRWVWLRSYLRERFGPRHPFPSYPAGVRGAGVYPLAAADGGSVRVALAGDWASGTDEAAAVASQIAAWHPHFTIHLGDVYYVGDAAEVRANFLGERTGHFEPVAWPRGSVGTFALNGNHEMYARGTGYFEQLLPAIGFGAQHGQPASFFCLENEYWRIVALDTGYNSVGWPLLEELPFWPFEPANNLGAPQLRWLRALLQADATPRALVILTHHGPYSRFERGYIKPARQLRRHIKGPVLWFWGHEHRIAVYGRHHADRGLEAWGRCIGHGGMPVEFPHRVVDASVPLEFTDERRYANDEHLELGYNGYATLEFTGDALAVSYCDLHGAALFREQWQARGGTLERGAAGPVAAAG